MPTAQFPKTYTAFQFEEVKGPLVKVEKPWKDPQANQVIIKVLASGVCGRYVNFMLVTNPYLMPYYSDTVVQAGFIGNPWPRVPGHEVIGDIVAVHPTVTGWKVGDRVGAPWRGGHCNVCKNCQAGLFTACEVGTTYTTGKRAPRMYCSLPLTSYAGGWRDGGYSQYCIIDITGICPLPNDIEPVEMAPMMCAGVTVYSAYSLRETTRHCRLTDGTRGHTVTGHPARRDRRCPRNWVSNSVLFSNILLTYRCRGLGHLAIQFYHAMGYRTIAISSGSGKRDLSLKLGAHEYIDSSKQNVVEELKKLGGADVIASTVPNAQGAFDLLEGLAYKGKLLILGLTGDMATLMPGMPESELV